MAPDELYFAGKRKQETVSMRVIDYSKSTLEDKPVSSVHGLNKYLSEETVTWLNVNGVHDAPLMEEIASTFEIDKVILADVMNPGQRPKVRQYPNCLFISIKMMQIDEKTDLIKVEHLSLIVTKSILISFQEKEGDVFDPIRDRINSEKKRIKSSGTDYLAYALLDLVIDNYTHVISIIGEQIEELDEVLQDSRNSEIIEDINYYKQEINFFRKNILPAKEVVISLAKSDDNDIIRQKTLIFYRDLIGSLNQGLEASESYREILSDQLNIHHTLISGKLNETMKVLTIISTVFIPLSFLAGVYGMNFKIMPERDYEYGYWIFWAIAIITATIMLIVFRRKKWF